MNDEIRIKVMKKLDNNYPSEMEIYRRWERCIDMYSSGFWSVPRSIEKILEKIDLEQHSSDDFIAASGLWMGLRIANRAPRAEEHRLETAKQDFFNRGYGSTPECDMKYYGISRDTLEAWTSELSSPQPEAEPMLLRFENELRTDAIELLTDRCSDE